MKNKKRKTKEFKRHEKVIKKLMVVTFLFVIILAHFIVYNVVLGRPITLSYAAETIGFRQEILPFDPVKSSEKLEVKKEKVADFGSSGYRIMNVIKNSDNAPVAPRKVLSSRIVNFNGTSVYPNSQIFLEIRSEKFFTSVLSDSQGKWTWTNYNHPLEDGEHSIEMYNISPGEMSGKRDIFAQKFFFVVQSDAGVTLPESLFLADSIYEEKPGGDDLGERLQAGKSGNTYIFNAILADKNEYYQNDAMNIQLMFLPLGLGKPIPAKISYAMFSYSGDNEIKTKMVSQFEDNVVLDGEKSFLKVINLKDQVIDENYMLKVMAKIGGDTYVQNVKFKIVSEPVIQIGGTVITQEKFGRVIVFNIVGVLAFIIIIFVLIIFELRRFMVYHEVGGSIFKKKGLISK